MSGKADSVPVFPDPGRAQSAKQRETLTNTGMTLRDYLAAKAMAALIVGRTWGHVSQDSLIETWAEGSYEIADAMLKAREA